MKSEKQKMLAGESYNPLDPELVADRRRAKILLKRFNIDHYVFDQQAAIVLHELMPDAHRSLYIETPFHCDYGYNIHCGPRVYFNTNCVILDVCRVSIGGGTLFGPAVHIYTATHPLSAAARKTSESGKPVIIGSNCWIGGGAIILPGVTIGDNCVIGAGSVVNRDIPPNSLAAGNPAKVKRQLE